ncbi:MAG: hypothetical protein H7Z72_05215 [Bacteroidetes bacterium]|nr:hypothetical protein [Fibrella sp.]
MNAEILKKYPYVALVKVKTMDQLLRPVNTPKPQSREGRFTVDILENFKNTLPDTLILESYNTSCDIGLRPGQTWIVFAKLVHGQAVVYACDYSLRYDQELKRGSGYQIRDRTGDELLNSLRRFTGRPIQATDNKIEQFYPNGQRALLTTYRRGGAEEERTVWYANGKLAGKESYKNGAINGRSTWWFVNGNPMVDEAFAQGIAIDTSRRWYDNNIDSVWVQTTPGFSLSERDSTLRASRQSNLQSISIADKKGQLLRSAQYSQEGRLMDESISVPETGVTCRTAYDKQGQINSLIVTCGYGVTLNREGRLLYRIDYEPDGSRQVAYYDTKGRLTRWVRVKEGIETVLQEKHYPD